MRRLTRRKNRNEKIYAMTEKIVITGGCGFIGTHFAELFASERHVVLFDSMFRDALSTAPELKAVNNIDIARGSVLDPEALAAAFAGADTVIHLAAIAGVSNYYNRSVETLRVNVLGTFNVLDAAIAAGVRRLIYFSSSEVYGSFADRVTEDMAMTSGPVADRRWVYSVSKQIGEHSMLRHGEEYNIGVTCLRPFNVYGPRQVGEGAVSNFCRGLVAGEPIRIFGDGADIRSWCYITDLLVAMERIIDNEATYGKSFNIGNPDAHCDINRLAEILIEANDGGVIERVEREHDPVPLRLPNITLARELFGFSPVVSVEDGMAKTLKWFKSVKP